jgi:PKD repeat protein
VKRVTLASATLFLLLAAGCSKNDPLPVPSFNMDGTNGYKAPCVITFNNTSSGAFSYAWWFGDSASVYALDPSGSTEQSPAHLYSKPGSYTVTLRAYTANAKEWVKTSRLVVIGDTTN